MSRKDDLRGFFKPENSDFKQPIRKKKKRHRQQRENPELRILREARRKL
jgi:hypothetical protein